MESSGFVLGRDLSFLASQRREEQGSGMSLAYLFFLAKPEGD